MNNQQVYEKPNPQNQLFNNFPYPNMYFNMQNLCNQFNNNMPNQYLFNTPNPNNQMIQII